MLPAEHLAALDAGLFERRWLRALAAGTPQVLVARSHGLVEGFIAFGPSRDADARAAVAEVWAFYVAPSAWSRGSGRALWLDARARLQAQGFAAVTLRVLAGNGRAIRFYAAAGFVCDMAAPRQITVGGLPLQELRCTCRLDTAPVPLFTAPPSA